MPVAVDQIIARGERMRTDRTSLDSEWDAVRRYIRPEGRDFAREEYLETGRNRQAVFDNTAELAGESMAAGLHAMFTNPARQWFALVSPSDRVMKSERFRLWAESSRLAMLAAMASPVTGFKRQSPAWWRDVAYYGNAGMYIAAQSNGLPLYQTRPLAEQYFAEGPDGLVDTNFRFFRMPARQIASRWGGTAGPRVNEAAGDPRKQEDKFLILHAVMPRRDRLPGRIDKRNKPFASIWILVDDKQLLEESGFDSFPYAIGRIGNEAGQTYGRGSGVRALPDTQMLQREAETGINGLEKLVDPPLQFPDDGVGGPLDLRPGAPNAVDGMLYAQMRGDVIRPIQTGGRPDIGEDHMVGVRGRIDAAFMGQQLRLLRDPRMTATQSLQLEEEALRLLGPVGGELEPEGLSRIVGRTFEIMQAGGTLPEPPPEMEGAELALEFQSPAALAQRQGEVRAIAETLDILVNFATAKQDPTVLDIFEPDKTASRVARLRGVPMDITRDEETLARMRQAQSEGAAEAARTEQIATLAKAAGQASPALAAAANAEGGNGQ